MHVLIRLADWGLSQVFVRWWQNNSLFPMLNLVGSLILQVLRRKYCLNHIPFPWYKICAKRAFRFLNMKFLFEVSSYWASLLSRESLSCLFLILMQARHGISSHDCTPFITFVLGNNYALLCDWGSHIMFFFFSFW